MDTAEKQTTLYVIPGSHACRTAMLMLEHKGIAYRRVELLTGFHSLSVRLRGFPGNRTPIREVDGRTHRQLAMMDRAGTVPALRFGSERVQTNHEIARFLERVQPEPPLFPADPERRAAVEEAERWGDGELQMQARRIALAGGDLDALSNRANDGRLGPLLAPGELMRSFIARGARRTFSVDAQAESKLLLAIPALLDRVDELLEQGVIGGAELNVADFVIVPSLALMDYKLDLRPEIESRPSFALVDRLLPEPASGGGEVRSIRPEVAASTAVPSAASDASQNAAE